MVCFPCSNLSPGLQEWRAVCGSRNLQLHGGMVGWCLPYGWVHCSQRPITFCCDETGLNNRGVSDVQSCYDPNSDAGPSLGAFIPYDKVFFISSSSGTFCSLDYIAPFSHQCILHTRFFSLHLGFAFQLSVFPDVTTLHTFETSCWSLWC